VLSFADGRVVDVKENARRASPLEMTW
jgi:hypothetical protein